MNTRAEQFINELSEKYLSEPSTPMTEAAFRNDVTCFVDQLYAYGNYLLDRSGEPIFDRVDVEIVVTRTNHTMSATTNRRVS